MENRNIESLIRMAIESDELDEPRAAEPRSAACLSMLRLNALAGANLPPTAREARHLAQCNLCRARFDAFAATHDAGLSPVRQSRSRRLISPSQKGTGTSQSTPGAPVRQARLGASPLLRRTAIRWSLGLGVAAAAASLILATWVSRDDTPGLPDTPSVPAVKSGQHHHIVLSVLPAPSDKSKEGPGVGHFVTRADESCVIVAVFRACDEKCECLDWELHEWDEKGRTLAELDPNELVEIALDVSDAPPMGQLLVLAASRGPGGLPTMEGDATALLECLNEVAPPVCGDVDFPEYASAVRKCLPSSVTLVERTFFPR